nr:MAG: DUF1335-containing protein WSV252 [White spot syndrome virus]BDX27714.1 MAG: DUF1335-containing protein WSV252 [White spot syndrome virus]BDX27874.1 MAG: DUF1335-containing protein WSV252 [White spot syndrome virus]
MVYKGFVSPSFITIRTMTSNRPTTPPLSFSEGFSLSGDKYDTYEDILLEQFNCFKTSSPSSARKSEIEDKTLIFQLKEGEKFHLAKGIEELREILDDNSATIEPIISPTTFNDRNELLNHEGDISSSPLYTQIMKHISPEHDIYELDLIVGTDLLFGLGVNLRNVSKLMKKISYGTLNVVDVCHRKFFNNRIIVNPISSSFSKNVCIIPLFSAAEEFSSLGECRDLFNGICDDVERYINSYFFYPENTTTTTTAPSSPEMEIADEEEQSPKTIKRNDNASRNWSGVCLIFEVFKNTYYIINRGDRGGSFEKAVKSAISSIKEKRCKITDINGNKPRLVMVITGCYTELYFKDALKQIGENRRKFLKMNGNYFSLIDEQADLIEFAMSVSGAGERIFVNGLGMFQNRKMIPVIDPLTYENVVCGEHDIQKEDAILSVRRAIADYNDFVSKNKRGKKRSAEEENEDEDADASSSSSSPPPSSPPAHKKSRLPDEGEKCTLC